MNFFLSSSSKARKIKSVEDGIPSFRDQIIAAAIPDLCITLYPTLKLQGCLTRCGYRPENTDDNRKNGLKRGHRPENMDDTRTLM